jgi:hypothetical protein
LIPIPFFIDIKISKGRKMHFGLGLREIQVAHASLGFYTQAKKYKLLD